MRLFVVEPLGSGGMIHYAYQLCTALANLGASVTLVTSYEYELDAFPHNFTVKKQMRLWKMFDPSSSKQPHSLLGRLWRNSAGQLAVLCVACSSSASGLD